MAGPKVSISRTTLSRGAWTYVWSHLGDLHLAAWTLVPGNYPLAVISLGLRSLEPTWDDYYHQALRVPNNVPIGSYQLVKSGVDTEVTISIEAAPDTTTPSPPAPIDPSVSDPATAIETALQSGNVALKGGTYMIDRAITVPTTYGSVPQVGRTLRGYGATLIRSYQPGYSVNPIFSFSGDGRFLVDGVTFAAERRPAGTYLDLGTVALADGFNQPRTNVTLRRCVSRNVNLGEWNKPGFLAEDCRWEEGGVCHQVTGPALFLRCTYRGLADPSFSQAWSTWVGTNMAILDCDFIGTDRGPIFNGYRGTIEKNLVSGVDCDHLAYIDNGCEGIGLEGANYPVNNNLFLHFRYRGEGPGLVMWGVNATGNRLRDFVMDGGFGIELGGGLQQTNNTFLEGEVRGGRCILDVSATNNVMQKVAFIGPRPTRGDLFNDVANTAPQHVITNFANNPGIDFNPNPPPPPAPQPTVKFARLLDGWTPTD